MRKLSCNTSTLSSTTPNQAVLASHIGLHINVSVQAPAGTFYGLVRSHSYTKGGKTITWRDIETGKGVFDWAAADEWVNTHYAAGRFIIADLCSPPDWAVTPAVIAGAAWGGKSNQPPTNNSDFTDFIAAFVTRYGTKIGAYDGWNEPNLNPKYYTGTAARLAELQRLLYQTVKANNPAAIVLSPEFTSVFSGVDGAPAGQVGLIQFLAASDGAGGTGKDWFDVCAYHFYCNDSALRPAGLERMYRGVRQALDAVGKSAVDIWATETGLIVPEFKTLDESARVALLQSYVYTLFALGCKRVIWFSVDEGNIGFMPESYAVWNAIYSNLVGNTIQTSAVKVIDQSTLETKVNGRTFLVTGMPA